MGMVYGCVVNIKVVLKKQKVPTQEIIFLTSSSISKELKTNPEKILFIFDEVFYTKVPGGFLT